jgi:sugar lactone lactonase YvrE
MTLRYGLAALALLTQTAMADISLTPAWTSSEGFKGPESVIYHPNTNALYVSNVNGSPMEQDGNGYISKITDEGELLSAEWLTGLDAPKGLTIVGDTLYVSDINQLVEIDLLEGKITARYQAPHAKFLNDVASDTSGNIYVSDMVTHEIYQLSGNQFSVWLADETLASPNGLLVEQDQLIVGSWGMMTDGFVTEVPGHLLSVSLDTKAISDLGDGSPVGNLDGVEADGQGHYLVTDWMAGRLLSISPNGHAETLIEFEQGSADHTVMPESNLVIIPLMLENKVTAYHLNR